jgi:hypothetical protein
MKSVRLGSAAVVVLALGVLSSAGCSSGPNPEPSAGNPRSETGSVSVSLTLPGGEQFSTFTATILGPNSFGSTMAVSVGSSTGLRFNVTLPSGVGYQAALSGTSVDGKVTCAGTSSLFNVTPGTTATVNIGLLCHVAAADAGQVALVGGSTNCATVESVLANPGETTVGSSVMLTASANGPDPSSLTFSWSAPSGTFGTATASTTSFTCTASGSVVVTVVSGDGAGPDGGPPCTDTATTTVICD